MNVAPQLPPDRPFLMRQNWRRLLFLHWALPPEVVQATLPGELWVEPWEGMAWVAAVPFAMEKVRLACGPPVPGISDFLELNVRTYVRDRAGHAGVWFYSLDCSQPLAVWGARVFYGLPYFRAAMRETAGLAWIDYECRRAGTPESASFRYRGTGPVRVAESGSIEEFLIERYTLFSKCRARLATARVWHEPYRIRSAEVARWSTVPLRLAGLDVGERPPDHAVFAPGVDVRVCGVEKL